MQPPSKQFPCIVIITLDSSQLFFSVFYHQLQGWAVKRENFKTLKKIDTWIFYVFIGHK